MSHIRLHYNGIYENQRQGLSRKRGEWRKETMAAIGGYVE